MIWDIKTGLIHSPTPGTALNANYHLPTQHGRYYSNHSQDHVARIAAARAASPVLYCLLLELWLLQARREGVLEVGELEREGETVGGGGGGEAVSQLS